MSPIPMPGMVPTPAHGLSSFGILVHHTVRRAGDWRVVSGKGVEVYRVSLHQRFLRQTRVLPRVYTCDVFNSIWARDDFPVRDTVGHLAVERLQCALAVHRLHHP